MSTLETNSIGKYNGNNVSVDDALRLKNYTTTQRNALTSVAGDTIYNTTDSKVQVYNGSSWDDLGAGAGVNIEYLIVAGGGGGGGGGINWVLGGGGGAGGLRNSYASENTGGGLSGETPLPIALNTNYVVSIGAGGSAGSGGYGGKGVRGSSTYFAHITAIGGGGGGVYTSYADPYGGSGGSTKGDAKPAWDFSRYAEEAREELKATHATSIDEKIERKRKACSTNKNRRESDDDDEEEEEEEEDPVVVAVGPRNV